ncbi:MFS transporter [Pseudomonas gingeri]|uniref:MFS transporter n=1 Tax=Pseudomonas gingeri TaxID=117681 RepID=A0A7Y7X9K7_9PSED|nr:MFS transporter [Pseudomonas gingeri]NWA28645.1 MFS transporter [Pseudomonas gingeri]NWB95722.1 MFS transporter [Pseudomonas gingeri]
MSIRNRSERLIVLLAALVAFAPLSIDTYLPSLGQIAQNLGSSAAQVQMTISVFLLGLCLGMLVYGPLSDRFGRRPVLLAGIALYLLASIGCATASSIDQLIFWRFVQALGGAAVSVLARPIVRDVFAVNDAARVLSLMHLVTLVAPLAGGAPLSAIVCCVIAFVSVTGLLGANSVASLLALFPQQAGAAAGLAVPAQFALGAAFSTVIGFYVDGTPVPMCVAMAIAGLGSCAAYLMVCLARGRKATSMGEKA